MSLTKAKLMKIIKEEIMNEAIEGLNYYRVLGIQPTDNIKSIKDAFISKRKSAGNDESEIDAITQAYEILLDPEEKQKYDKELYDSAIKFLDEKPDAKFHGLNGLPLNKEVIAKLKDMSENPASVQQRASDIKAGETPMFDPNTGMPLSVKAMETMMQKFPERVREEILPKVQVFINDIKDKYGNTIASLLVNGYFSTQEKAEALFALLQASNKLSKNDE